MTNLWNWFNGKKRDLAGLFCFFTGTIVPLVWANGLPYPWNKIVAVIGAIMMATGWTHAGQKYLADKKAKIESGVN